MSGTQQTQTKNQDVSVAFQAASLLSYKLPFLFELGRCMSSDAYVSCEINVPQMPDPTHTFSLQNMNKLLLSVTYPKKLGNDC